MRKISILLALFVLTLSSCSTDFSDAARELLGTVPSDSEAVGLINLQSAAGSLTASGNAVIKTVMRNEKFSGDIGKLKTAGVDMSAAAFFIRGSKVYLTGFLDDSESFRSAVEKEAKSHFAQIGDIGILETRRGGYVAVADRRFWIVSSGTADADEIKRYLTLPESQSVLKDSYVDSLAEGEDDVRVIGHISSLLSSVGEDTQMKVSLAMNMLFDDPANIDVRLNFKKGIEVAVTMLDSKYRNARFILPLRKIDTSTVAALGGEADTLLAFSLPGVVAGQLTKQFGQMLPLAPLASVDGTVACALGRGNILLSGIVQTNGEDVSSLCEFIDKQGFKAEIEGKRILFRPASAASASGGNIDVAQTAGSFDDCYIAAELSAPLFPGSALSRISVRLRPQGNSAQLSVTIK